MKIFWAGQFKRDYKQVVKNLKEPDQFRAELKEVITILAAGKKLDDSYTANRLNAKGVGWYDCYVYLDIVMIYCIMGERVIFSRLGKCSELYKES